MSQGHLQQRRGLYFKKIALSAKIKRRHIPSKEKEQLLQSATKGEAAKQITSEKVDEERHACLPSPGRKHSPLQLPGWKVGCSPQPLGPIGPRASIGKARGWYGFSPLCQINGSITPSAAGSYRLKACLKPFWAHGPHCQGILPETPLSITLGLDIQQISEDNVNKLKCLLFLELK